MWQILALLSILVGVLIVYSTNKNQGFIKKSLSKKWRILGYFFWLLSLTLWLQTHTLSAGFFTWFFTLSTCLACIPFISLLITTNKSNHDNKELHHD